MMFVADKWKDYEVIDTDGGEKLERWGSYLLIRPDPQVLWRGVKTSRFWMKSDADYRRSSSGGGSWSENSLPEAWNVSYRDLTFRIRPMGFKHTGIFPEQAVNWDFCAKRIENALAGGKQEFRVLNLFEGFQVCALAELIMSAGIAVVHEHPRAVMESENA